jgi:hypothetical protein
MEIRLKNLLILAAVIAVCSASGATAGSLITSKQIKDGTIQTKDLSASARKSLKGAAGAKGDKGDSGARGVQGAKGDDGSDGVDGENAVSLWAVVQPAGTEQPTLVRGSGVVSVARVGTGDFAITFNRAINTCAWHATLGSSDHTYPSVSGWTTPTRIFSSNDTDVLEVLVFNSNLAQLDPYGAGQSIHVTVTCP